LHLKIYKEKFVHTDIEDTDYLFDATTEKKSTLVDYEKFKL